MEKTRNQVFDWVQLALLIVTAPLFLFPRPRYWWIVFIIPLLWITRKFIEKRFIERTPLDLPLFIFLAAVLVSTVRASDFSHNLPKSAGVFFAIGFFYALVALLKTETLLKWAAGLFLTGGIFFSLIGLLGMPTFTDKHLTLLMKIKDKIPRIDFGLPGAELGFAPTVVGGILLLVIPLFVVTAAYVYLHPRKSTRNKIYIALLLAGLAITGGVLLLTQARGAWAGLVLSTLIIGILLLMKLLKRKRVFAAIIVLFIFLGTIVGIGAYSAAHADQLQPGIRQAEGTLLFRFQMWDLAIPLIRANPVWGIGLNNFRLVPEVRYFLSHAHNQFLHEAVELGIPAMIAYMAMLLVMGYICLWVWKTSQNQWLRFTVLGLGWGQLAHLFFCLTDAIPPGAKVGILFWISLALISGLYKLSIVNAKVAQAEDKEQADTGQANTGRSGGKRS